MITATLALLMLFEANGHASEKKFRLSNFSELMSPSAGSTNGFISSAEGSPLAPAFLSGFVWSDYEIGSDYRLLYFQKYNVDLAGADNPTGISGRFLDPRFGIRKSKVFDVAGMTTDYDLFFQPGLLGAFMPQPGRSFDLGIRANTRYSIPGTRWSVGGIVELTYTFYREESSAANLSGVLVPWVSYDLSSRVSTQHYVVAPYKHNRGEPLGTFHWDITGMPYIQNGIGVAVVDGIWVAAMINNYLLTPPTLKNTWASLWVSATVF